MVPQTSFVTFSVSIPANVLDRIDELADAAGRPRAHLVRLLLARVDAGEFPAAWFETADLERVAVPRRAGRLRKRKVTAE